MEENAGIVEEQQKLSSNSERASALAAVMRHEALKAEAAEAAYRPPLSPRRIALSYMGLALSTALAFWIWFFPPGWVQRSPVPVPTLEQDEASLRLVMFLQAQRIESFRIERGRLPENLEEAGVPLPGVDYTPMAGQTYYLRGEGGQAHLGYYSSQPMETFLGDSEDLLALEVEQ